MEEKQTKQRPKPTTLKNELTSKQVRSFRNKIYAYFSQNKRTFPWRTTTNPYHILVSEIMLQQTQADRVIEKYQAFIKRFPTIKILAQVPLRDVLVMWQGLGYNRRPRNLQLAAIEIRKKYYGKIPVDPAVLSTLPGIGPYTAAAIAVFAHNAPIPMIETNIRSVYLHHFFSGKKNVDDKKLVPLIEQTLDKNNPKKWFCALMDYGAYLKKIHPNPNRKSKHYSTQSRFEGSNRQIRGNIIKSLLTRPHTLVLLKHALNTNAQTIQTNITQMKKEGLIKKQGNQFVVN